MDKENGTTSGENPVYMPSRLSNFLRRLESEEEHLQGCYLTPIRDEITYKTRDIYKNAIRCAQTNPNEYGESPEEALEKMFLSDHFPQIININVIPRYAPPKLAERTMMNMVPSFGNLSILKESERWAEPGGNKYSGRIHNLPTTLGEHYTLTAYETKDERWILILSIKRYAGINMVINNLPQTEILA